MEAQPMETLPEQGEVLVRRVNDGQWAQLPANAIRFPAHFTAWCPIPSGPQPDPMTVVARHPMDTLPDGCHDEVLVRCEPAGFEDRRFVTATNTKRSGDNKKWRLWWCPIEPLIALIPEGETT